MSELSIDKELESYENNSMFLETTEEQISNLKDQIKSLEKIKANKKREINRNAKVIGKMFSQLIIDLLFQEDDIIKNTNTMRLEPKNIISQFFGNTINFRIDDTNFPNRPLKGVIMVDCNVNILKDSFLSKKAYKLVQKYVVCNVYDYELILKDDTNQYFDEL